MKLIESANYIMLVDIVKIQVGDKITTDGTKLYNVNAISNNKLICYQGDEYVGDFVTDNINVKKVIKYFTKNSIEQ